MTIYNINLGIGWASSGVEYAQLYRAKVLRKLKHPTKFIFLDFIQQENIQTLTHHLGFNDDEIIWLYQYFTDISIAPSVMRVDEIIEKLNIKIDRSVVEERIQRIYYDNYKNYLQIYLDQKDFVNKVEYISRGKLLKTEHYSYTLVYTEYFAPKDNQACRYMSEFYNEDGSVAYRIYHNEEVSMYVFPTCILYSKQELIAYFMQSLALTSTDIILLDRSKDFGQVILENKNQAKLGIVIHAEHYNEAMTTEHHILWNNYYEYVFTYANEVDFFITATPKQRDILSHQFNTYYSLNPKIYSIPVGSLDKLSYPSIRRPYSIVTASRLAKEKHIDWLVKAVIEAKKTMSNLTFDIYGEGPERHTIKRIIDNNHVENDVRMLGHVDLEDIYKEYELFLSGSTSEGFGLTLMEAIGSGLGIIGFNVNYGNPTFIENKKNGYLIPLNLDKETEIINKLSKAIIKYFNEDRSKAHQVSYDIAEKYTQQAILKLWQKLFNEVQYD